MKFETENNQASNQHTNTVEASERKLKTYKHWLEKKIEENRAKENFLVLLAIAFENCYAPKVQLHFFLLLLFLL